ncbi:MAG: SH3 domain-containing protein [Lachnospiraceae bacterium]|nr:SH3 domain-containing protein [Lachnospiraceae bacterium]
MVISGTQSTYAYTAVKGTVTCTSGKVRKEASTNASFAFGVRRDEGVTVVDELKGSDGKLWYKIQVGSSTGYIRSDLVKKSNTKADGTGTVSESSDNGKAVSAAKGTVPAKVLVDLAIMREAASTGSQITMCIKQNTDVNVTGAVQGADGKKWYSVTYNKGNITYKGYLRSDLVKTGGEVAVSSEQTQPASNEASASQSTGDKPSGTVQVGKIKGLGVNVRTTAVSGEVICRVTSGQSVTVTEQVSGSDGKVWYKISFISNMTPQTGYIRSDFVEGVNPSYMAQQEPASEAGSSDEEEKKEEEKEEKKEKKEYESHKGAVNGTNVNVRKKPGNGEIITWLSTGSTVTVTNEQTLEDGHKWYEISYKFNKDEYTGWMLSDYIKIENNTSDYTDALTALVRGSGVRVRESAVNGTVVEQLSSGHRLSILGEVSGSDDHKWYYIEFTCKGVEKKGYIRSDFVNVITTEASTKLSDDVDFENSISSLPESYKANLRTLHEKYPNWRFETVETGLDWSEAVEAECSVGKNLVAMNSISSWKSTAPQAYNWGSNSWYGFDGGTWASASKELISYYMDPRNFLDESGIFQFETLDSLDYQNEEGVTRIAEGTFLNSTFVDTDGAERSYASVITEAARAAGISPYHLATRILQEQGLYGRSQSISGTLSGHEGYFNYFNIGAYAANGRLPVENGLIYAAGNDEEYYRPWNSRYKSILGSAKYVAEKYVKKGQNTLYFEKFNVVNKQNGIYSHQYMSNIQAASSESARMRKANTDTQATLVFRIPYYYNMPDTPCEKPTSESDPNNYLSSLYVEGLGIAPEFSANVDTYYLTVDNSVESINVVATPVASTSAVGGTGTVQLNTGTNTIPVVCKAQNGNTRTYTLYVQRN